MSIVNKDIEEGETKIVNSRYSIVLATSKRARQIIDGSTPLVSAKSQEKPLSIAIDELYNEQLKIMAENTDGDIDLDPLVENYSADEDIDIEIDIDIDSLIEEYHDEDTLEEENVVTPESEDE
jgi:DNA-directed RNA polymerase subunit omega